jgi:hypothetical protein
MDDVQSALKGPDPIAQGNALGLGFGRSAAGMEFRPVLLSPRERSGEGIK